MARRWASMWVVVPGVGIVAGVATGMTGATGISAVAMARLRMERAGIADFVPTWYSVRWVFRASRRHRNLHRQSA